MAAAVVRGRDSTAVAVVEYIAAAAVVAVESHCRSMKGTAELEIALLDFDIGFEE